MPECKMCTLEVPKLHPSGQCQECERFCTSDPVKRAPNTIFEFDSKVEETLTCAKCGATEFSVGKGNYWTSIRCSRCKWERCIHEG